MWLTLEISSKSALPSSVHRLDNLEPRQVFPRFELTGRAMAAMHLLVREALRGDSAYSLRLHSKMHF